MIEENLSKNDFFKISLTFLVVWKLSYLILLLCICIIVVYNGKTVKKLLLFLKIQNLNNWKSNALPFYDIIITKLLKTKSKTKTKLLKKPLAQQT